MTKPYTPRLGTTPEKAIEFMRQMPTRLVSTAELASHLGISVTSIRSLLDHAILRGVIILERRAKGGGTKQGGAANWYGLPPPDEPRTLPPSSVFDLGAPARPAPENTPVADPKPAIKTTLNARFAVWSDGETQIQRGNVRMTLSPDESRKLAAAILSGTSEAVDA